MNPRPGADRGAPGEGRGVVGGEGSGPGGPRPRPSGEEEGAAAAGRGAPAPPPATRGRDGASRAGPPPPHPTPPRPAPPCPARLAGPAPRRYLPGGGGKGPQHRPGSETPRAGRTPEENSTAREAAARIAPPPAAATRPTPSPRHAHPPPAELRGRIRVPRSRDRRRPYIKDAQGKRRSLLAHGARQWGASGAELLVSGGGGFPPGVGLCRSGGRCGGAAGRACSSMGAGGGGWRWIGSPGPGLRPRPLGN